MTQAPPPPFTAQPRPSAPSGYGSVDKFEALGEGCLGLNWVLAANVALMVGLQVAWSSQMGAFLIYAGVMALIIAALSYPSTKKIAHGLGSTDRAATFASFLLGINSLFFFGIAGYLLLQTIAVAEMKKYGLQSGFWLRRKDFEKTASRIHRTGATPMDFPSSPRW